MLISQPLKLDQICARRSDRALNLLYGEHLIAPSHVNLGRLGLAQPLLVRPVHRDLQAFEALEQLPVLRFLLHERHDIVLSKALLDHTPTPEPPAHRVQLGVRLDVLRLTAAKDLQALVQLIRRHAI
eukprot:4117310-Prymnesium_polylepis.1